MVKFKIIGVCVLVIFVFVSCSNNAEKKQNYLGYSKSKKGDIMFNDDYTNKRSKGSTDNLNAPYLIVNEKVIKDNRIKIDLEHNNAEIPLLLVLKELGANIKWYNDSVVNIRYKGKTITIDITDEWFGILPPPGTEKAKRYFKDDEMIVDIVSFRGLLNNFMGASFSFDETTIYIKSVDQTNY